MKNIKKMAVTACLAISVLSACGQAPSKEKSDLSKTKGKGFAVLEMFTSEGCSSCPPADALMAKIQKESLGRPVYILSYHVDYWNRQGWKDIYSNSSYSDRQRLYANWLNRPQIYTPQLVVNGQAEYIGSEERIIRDAISEQLEGSSSAKINIQATQDPKNLNVQYQASGATKHSVLLIALVQKKAVSKVLAGENAGNSLSHIQIIRKLQSQSINETGSGSLKVALTKDFNQQNYEIIGLIQDEANGEILAVANTTIKPL